MTSALAQFQGSRALVGERTDVRNYAAAAGEAAAAAEPAAGAPAAAQAMLLFALAAAGGNATGVAQGGPGDMDVDGSVDW